MNELKLVGRRPSDKVEYFTCRVFGLSTRDVVYGRYPVAEVSVRDVRGRLRQQVAAACVRRTTSDDQFPRPVSYTHLTLPTNREV